MLLPAVAPDDVAASQLTMAATLDGRLHLTGEAGERTRQAIEAKADEPFHRFATDNEQCRIC